MVGQGWRWWIVCMRTKPLGVGRMSGDAMALPECNVKTDDTRSHSLAGAHL